MININPEIVCQIIEKARLFSVKEEAPYEDDIPDIEYEYDWAQVLADHADDLSFQEVKQTIADLEPDQRVALLALMYVGRGDFSGDEWELACEEAKQNIRPHLTEYFFSKPLIANYLQDGLRALGYDCED